MRNTSRDWNFALFTRLDGNVTPFYGEDAPLARMPFRLRRSIRTWYKRSSYTSGKGKPDSVLRHAGSQCRSTAAQCRTLRQRALAHRTTSRCGLRTLLEVSRANADSFQECLGLRTNQMRWPPLYRMYLFTVANHDQSFTRQLENRMQETTWTPQPQTCSQG